MPINKPAKQVIKEALYELAHSLDNTPYGKRGPLVGAFSQQHNWSRNKTYRMLENVGWDSGRKPRKDRGETSQDMQSIIELSSFLDLGIRKNGKPTMHTPNARSVLSVNGRNFNVSNSRINTLLKQRQMGLAAKKQDTPFQAQRSFHPNHVHLVDPSLCLLYYLPDGSQKMIRDDEVYKNKPEAIENIGKLKVWRYVLVDHYSHTLIVRYYQSKGETQANLFDFLLYCWSLRKDRPFHGVPKVLYWDKGSANSAKAIKNALRALDVKAITHEKGRARAKGSVEKANDLVEILFESRLKYEPVQDIDELNVAAEGWCNAYNSNSIPNYDSRLNRKHMAEPKARYALWQIIRKEQLRILPDAEVCRYLLSADPVERKVNRELAISFKHPAAPKTRDYDLRNVPGAYVNATVRVSPLVYGNLQVIVFIDNYRGDEESMVLEPTEVDEFSGFRLDAAVIGEEMKRPPDTLVEQASKAADKVAYPGLNQDEIKKAKDKNAVPFNGEINAHSHLANVQQPAYMRRPGSELTVPDRVNVPSKPMTVVEACKRLVKKLGRTEGINYHPVVSEWYPNGVPKDEFDKLVQQIERHIQSSALPGNEKRA